MSYYIYIFMYQICHEFKPLIISFPYFSFENNEAYNIDSLACVSACVCVFYLQCRLILCERCVPENIAQFKTTFHIGNKVGGWDFGAHKFTTIIGYLSLCQSCRSLSRIERCPGCTTRRWVYFIFTLNVSFFSVFCFFLKCNIFFFFGFYFYWSHRSMYLPLVK